MSKTSHNRPTEDETREAMRAEQVATAIAAAVLKTLGRPTDLFRVAVVRLWGTCYRVNVQTGPDAASARITHSFFLTADESGGVISSEPVIARLY